MPTGFAERILWDKLLKNVVFDDLFVSVLLPLLADRPVHFDALMPRFPSLFHPRLAKRGGLVAGFVLQVLIKKLQAFFIFWNLSKLRLTT